MMPKLAKMKLDDLKQTLRQEGAPRSLALGLGWDAQSSWMRGSAAAPEAVAPYIFHEGYNTSCELGLDLEPAHLQWGGAVELGDAPFETIQQAGSLFASASSAPIIIGGDHAITYPFIKGLAADADQRFSILHIDAHPDLYDALDGNRLSHACPFARIMEEGLVDRLVQVGIRTMTGHQRAQAARFGVEVMEMKDYQPGWRPDFDGPVYLSLDLDGIDPAFAPGVAHAEPGGLTSRQVINMIHALKGHLIGADIVEYNPARDLNDVTAVLTAKLIREIAGCIALGSEK